LLSKWILLDAIGTPCWPADASTPLQYRLYSMAEFSGSGRGDGTSLLRNSYLELTEREKISPHPLQYVLCCYFVRCSTETVCIFCRTFKGSVAVRSQAVGPGFSREHDFHSAVLLRHPGRNSKPFWSGKYHGLFRADTCLLTMVLHWYPTRSWCRTTSPLPIYTCSPWSKLESHFIGRTQSFSGGFWLGDGCTLDG